MHRARTAPEVAWVLESIQIADDIVAGFKREEFLILPHPIVRDFVQAKAHNHQKWLKTMMGMNKAFMGNS